MPDAGQLLFQAAMGVAGVRHRLSILIYHRVVPERDPMRPGVPTTELFRWHMQLLQQHFNVLPLAEALRRMKEGSLPPRPACVTFDDGYADNATVALPIMKEYRIPLTVFVASGYLDGGCMWNDSIVEALRTVPSGKVDLSEFKLPTYEVDDYPSRRRAAYDIIDRAKYLEQPHRQNVVQGLADRVRTMPRDLMMTSSQVREISSQGVEIGGHTVTHPILARLSPEAAQQEITHGRSTLEKITDQPVRFFAYPNGKPGADYTQDHVAMVKKAGFEAAVSTGWGTTDQTTDLFQLPRFTPWDRTRGRFLARMLMNSRTTHR